MYIIKAQGSLIVFVQRLQRSHRWTLVLSYNKRYGMELHVRDDLGIGTNVGDLPSLIEAFCIMWYLRRFMLKCAMVVWLLQPLSTAVEP